jgi:hypothetical protein
MSLRVGIPSIGMRGNLSQYEQYRNAAISAARNNNASLWYAGAAADLSGFVFQDSTGTTPATNGSGGTGANLLSAANQNFSAGNTWAASSATIVTGSPGYADFVATGIGSVNVAVATTIGATYTLTFTVSGYSGSASISPNLQFTAQPLTARAGNGTFTETFVSTANNAELYFSATAGPYTGRISNVSLQPVTVGDPVGLLLDRSYGAGNLGPELVGDPTFSTPAYWSVDAGVAVTGGQAVWTASALNAAVYKSGLLTVGQTYQIEFDIVSISGGGLFVDTGSGTNPPTKTTPGRYSCKVTVGATLFIVRCAASTTAAIDNITCKQIFGYPALQATSGNRPTLELQANGYYGMRFDGVNDFLAGPAPASLPASETIIACGAFASTSTTQYLMARRVGASGVMLRCESAGNIIATGLTGAGFGTVDLGIAIVNAPDVLSLVAQNNDVKAWRNGVAGTPSITTFLAADTSTSVGLGNISGNAAAGSTMNGKGWLYFWAPAAVPDADRIAIERFAALLSGATYV